MSRRQPLSDFYFLRFKAGYIDRTRAAELLGVCPRTIRNWDRNGCPLHVSRFLHLLAGDLGELFKPWKGFRMTAEGLIGPGRLRIPIEHLKNYPASMELLERSLMELDQLRRWSFYRFLLRWWPGRMPGRPQKRKIP